MARNQHPRARRRPLERGKRSNQYWGYGKQRMDGISGMHHPEVLMTKQCGYWVLADWSHGTRDRCDSDHDCCRPAPPYPVVSVTATDATASEDGSTGAFTISRTVTTGSLTVYFALTGTATQNTDYTASATRSVAFADGDSTKTVTITPLSDAADESSETVVLSLVHPPEGGSYNIDLSAQAATVTIENVSIPTANMLWHFKADAITGVSDGAELSSWVDSAPTPHNMKFPGTNGGTKPSYKNNGTDNINGKPVVQVGSGDQGDIPYPNFSPSITNKSFTHYWVGRYNNVQAGQGILLYNYTTNGQKVIRLALSLDIGGSNGVGYEYDVGGGPVDVFIAAGTNAVQLITFVFDKTAGNAKVYRNGTQIGSTSTNVGAGGYDWGEDFIEFFAVAGGSNAIVGEHAELIGYQTAHDDTTRGQVENALKSKYGIA